MKKKCYTVAPVIKEQLKLRREQKLIVIECIVRAASAPKVSWLKENQVIREDTRHSVKITEVSKGQYQVTLEIKTPSKENRGTYNLVAKNEKGEAASEKIQVEVDGNPFSFSFSLSLFLSLSCLFS